MSNEFLTQEEIDALLRGDAVAEASSDPESAADTNSNTDTGLDIDTESMPELTDLEKDTLAEVGNISMGSAATALSTLVNRRVWITVPSVKFTTMQDVVKSFPVPCVIVRVEYKKGLEGANMLIIKDSDAAVIASLMMGEDGKNPPKVLDELQLSAVEEAMNQMMGAAATSMSQMFNEMIDISPPSTEYERVESSKELASVVQPLIQVSFRMEIEDLVDSELVQLIDYDFGRKMVRRLLPDEQAAAQLEAVVEVDEPVRKEPPQSPVAADKQESEPSFPNPLGQAGSERWAPASLAASSAMLGNVNIELIRNIPVKIRAVLGRTRLPIETILRLSNGSLIELDTLDGEPIEILANDTLVAKGEVVVVGEQFGVRITEIATRAERISSISS